MDVDWCLTCEKRVEAPNLYCSTDCGYIASTLSDAPYSDEEEDDKIIIFHPVDSIPPLDITSRWTGNDFAGISAWAAEIPYGPPAVTSCQPPQLLPPHHQIVPPSLCTNMTQPATPRPSSPLLTPKPHSIVQPSNGPNTSRISLKSEITESSLATPASSSTPISAVQQPPNQGRIRSHLRSCAIPPCALAPFKRVTSFAKVKRNTRLQAVKVVSPPDTPNGFLDEGAVQWKASAISLEQPHIKHVPKHQRLRGHCLPHEFPLQADQDPSFRTRGRKASRAVA